PARRELFNYNENPAHGVQLSPIPTPESANGFANNRPGRTRTGSDRRTGCAQQAGEIDGHGHHWTPVILLLIRWTRAQRTPDSVPSLFRLTPRETATRSQPARRHIPA